MKAPKLTEEARVRAKILDWAGDHDIVAEEPIDEFGTVIAVIEKNLYGQPAYDVVRAFPLGAGVGLSVELQNGTAIRTMRFLLKNMAMARMEKVR